MPTKYQVVFNGTLKAGSNAQDASNKLAALFKTDANKFDNWFSGKAIIVKKDLELEQAKKYVLALQNAGLIAEYQTQAVAAPSWDIAALGSDVLRPDELPATDVVNVDISALRAMDNSELDLTPPESPPVSTPDTNHLDVLPPGEIENLPDLRKPLTPDISKLSIVAIK
jgi:hypothetical protein